MSNAIGFTGGTYSNPETGQGHIDASIKSLVESTGWKKAYQEELERAIRSILTAAVEQAKAEERRRCVGVARDYALLLREESDALAAGGDHRKAQRLNRDAGTADIIAARIESGEEETR